jgi:hypothetical protein
MFNETLRIKWAGPNTPFIELNRNDDRLYPTKRELVAIMDGIKEFMEQYPESFTEEAIDFDDIADDNYLGDEDDL